MLKPNWRKFRMRVVQGLILTALCATFIYMFPIVYEMGAIERYTAGLFTVFTGSVTMTALFVLILVIEESIKGE